ncbi:MAG: MFS transporter [Methylobacteriaceae bacterium]|nr:MFS transporter [Methylobacteriaceae bacterium]
MRLLFSTRLAEPESGYAWMRLAVATLVGTVACIGTWSVVVAIPVVEQEFGTARAGASFPYSCAMAGFAFGTLAMGRLADRWGVVAPVLLAAALLLIGYAGASQARDIWQFALLHVLVGLGGSAGFAPMMADVSHWFTRRRGLAVVVAATGSYLAGAIWPQLFQLAMAAWGWRNAHLAAGLVTAAVLVPLAFVFRVRPQASVFASAEAATQAARSDLGLSPRLLQTLLAAAGFCCCVAMSMPQVHIVAYCGDLGYGVARGAQMLAVMLGLGIVSRVASGALADRIGGVATLLIGSFMQAMALFLYLFFDGLASLFLISAIFGLFQGGIVPMYAVIVREFMPPREAGARIGVVITMTILGMSFGGWFSGWLFDQFGSYRVAFLNGLAWNFVNLALAAWLFAAGARRLRPA